MEFLPQCYHSRSIDVPHFIKAVCVKLLKPALIIDSTKTVISCKLMINSVLVFRNCWATTLQ